MSHQISQNKSPKKMGHMGMQKPHINTDNTMLIGDTGKGPLSPSTTKEFSDLNSPTGNESNDLLGTPYLSQNEPLKNYSNKFMEQNKMNKSHIQTNIIKNTDNFSYMNYNTESLEINNNESLINEEDINKTNLLGYDTLFSNFDNYGNNRDISLVNNDMINTFQQRFIKESTNKIQHDIDVTGFSHSNKINGSNLNQLDSFHSAN